MKRKYILLINILIITILYGCGYKPVYSSKDLLFKINKITHDNSKINNQIARSLKSISNDETTNTLNLELNSNKEKIIVSKNKNGDPEMFELKILVNIKVKNKEKNFLGKQVYKNIENKFELNEYEIQIERQIISRIIDEVIFFLLELR
jgi:outer membrane lipopolysaccharide assembly protein LptE/RlpB